MIATDIPNKPFGDWKPLNCTLAKSEGPDEMLHNVASHQGLHCLKVDLPRKEYNIF